MASPCYHIFFAKTTAFPGPWEIVRKPSEIIWKKYPDFCGKPVEYWIEKKLLTGRTEDP
jgi:hypothetical protein